MKTYLLKRAALLGGLAALFGIGIVAGLFIFVDGLAAGDWVGVVLGLATVALCGHMVLVADPPEGGGW